MTTRIDNQVEDMVGAWTRFQGQLWDSMFGIGRPGPPWDQIYSRPLEIGEDLVNCWLQQQSDCIRITMKNMRPGNGAPRIASDWVDQVENSAQHWVDAQRQAWKTWFAAIRQMDPARLQGKPKGKAESQAANVFEAWNQVTQKTLQAQADWVSTVASATANVAEEAAETAKAAGSNGAQVVQEAAGSTNKKAASKGTESRRAS
jgi:hypothetical protein